VSDEPIREAIQKMLDAHPDGWSVAQHVVCMALERVVDGRIESIAWHWTPPDQPDWMTDALIERAIRARDDCCAEDDD
jgi:hypothetical protein